LFDTNTALMAGQSWLHDGATTAAASTSIFSRMKMHGWMSVRKCSASAKQLVTCLSECILSTVICMLPDGRGFSFGESGAVMHDPIGSERESRFGLAVHSTEEVLGRKIRAWMVNTIHYLVRGACDVARATICDPTALRRVLGRLVPDEQEALAYDAAHGNISLNAEKPLLDPKHVDGPRGSPGRDVCGAPRRTTE